MDNTKPAKHLSPTTRRPPGATLLLGLVLLAAAPVAGFSLSIAETSNIAPASIPVGPAGLDGVGMVALSTSSSFGWVDIIEMTLDLTGTVPYDQISEIRVYFDDDEMSYDNDNNDLTGDDVRVDTGGPYTFDANGDAVINIAAAAHAILEGTLSKFYVVFDFLPGAYGTTAGCEIVSFDFDPQYGGVDTEAPDPHGLTGQVDDYDVTAAATWIGPAEAGKSEMNVPALRVDLQATDATVTASLRQMTLRMTGTATKPDLGLLRIWNDTDDSGTFDPDNDTYLGAAPPGLTHTIVQLFLPLSVDSAGVTLFVSADLAWNAVVDHIMGFEIEDPSTDIEFVDMDGDLAIAALPYVQKGYVSSSATIPAVSGTFVITEPPDLIPPFVTYTNPPDTAVGVPMDTTLTVSFSEEVDPATVTNTSFTLYQDTTQITGTVQNTSSVTATFTPDPQLQIQHSTTYTATIASTVTDVAETPNAMGADYVWTFTTLTPPSPTVTYRFPANGATNVALTTEIAATFSKDMTPGSINDTTFTLVDSALNPVAGTVTYNAGTATFTPSAPLVHSTQYTATITTGATDTSNPVIPLAAPVTWSFTTLLPPAPTVTYTYPGDLSTGAPLNVQIQAAFSKDMDPLTIDETTFTLMDAAMDPVAGTVAYAAGTATFTPSAPLVHSSDYTATVTTGVTDDSAPGVPMALNKVWTFTTLEPPPPVVVTVFPVDGGTNAALNTVITATFSKTMTPATINGTTFTLMDGATPVAGSVTYSGVTATFTPTLPLVHTTVYTATVTTGVTDNSVPGVPMAADEEWSFTTMTPTAPTVSNRVPMSGATNVPLETTISATFSKEMDDATIIAESTFTLVDEFFTPVSGTVIYVAGTATFTPSLPLVHSRDYTATVTTGVTDTSNPGVPMAANEVWSFTTMTPVAPIVSNKTPMDEGTSVPLDTTITATFSKAMTSGTIDETTFLLEDDESNPVTGDVTYAGVTATFTPTLPLVHSSTYTATVTTGVEDASTPGVPMASDEVWSFTTIVPTTPSVTYTYPSNGATGVPLDTILSATFSKDMDSGTLTGATVTLTDGGSVPGTIDYDGGTLTFTPDDPLVHSTLYTMTIDSTVTDASAPGVPMAADKVWSFTTMTPPAPTVVTRSPSAGSRSL